jgi:hypothetical protein
MNGNISIPDLPVGDEVWLVVVVGSVRDKRTQQGELFQLCSARNATGKIQLKIPSQNRSQATPMKPGLWRVAGKTELFQNQLQLTVLEYNPVTAEEYNTLQASEPPFPRAYTIDLESIPLPAFRERAPVRLKRAFQSGRMSAEQSERYLEDPHSEADRAFKLGSLAATSGRVLSIAVHIGPVAGIDFSGPAQPELEYVFGIDPDGTERDEPQTLNAFLKLLSSFDPEVDEIVGHNIVAFDLPFIFQRCLINNIDNSLDINLSEHNPRGVFDTMHRWCFGGRNRVSLDDLAWALGFESSKTDEVEGSKVFDLYQAGSLVMIREYNLEDVRLTRKIYDRLVSSWGR